MLNIEIQKLKVKSQEKILLDISFKITKSTALIGESGSGKSLTLKALLNLLPSSLDCEKEINSNFDLDFNSIGFIPQNPFTSLSPMTKINKQFFCKKEKKEEVLKLVDLDTWVLDKFPSQLSGGQIQRVIIAIALSKEIKFLLLDEPTTALDIENRNNIINLVDNLRKDLKILILFVTHDIESVKDICEEIVIIKNGLIIEQGNTKSVLSNPTHDYTKTLINSTFKNKDFRK
ncbi:MULTISPECIES: ATP-binding cassette domain-containing protein [Arcobacteraceae]|uniref:ABC transporter ATP-binding protein n=1 Tax=Poseidonibacter parvus TaxID=1850254 RepID=A0A1P8KPJ4_9BACT|nr:MULTISPECIES: ATP-binding cassette domain-containing protein [Arcobacteraceae]APW66465.1 ABC transporter ATP-binding protein [Poseidonibacter parvus]